MQSKKFIDLDTKVRDPFMNMIVHTNTNEAERIVLETLNNLQTKIEEKMIMTHSKLFSSKLNASQFIKYKPKTQYLQSSTEKNPRVIQMQEISSDPLDPPKHRLMKVEQNNRCVKFFEIVIHIIIKYNI